MPNALKRVTIDEIVDNEHNARSTIGDVEDLAESIVNTGLLEPLVVYKDGDKYRLIAGHRRRAAIELAIKSKVLDADYPIDVVVRPKVADETQLAMMLVENMQRVDLPLLDQVKGIFALVSEHGWTQAQVASALGQNIKLIKQRAKWATLPDEVIGRVESGHLRIQDLDSLAGLDQAVVTKLVKKPHLQSWDIESAVKDKTRKRECAAFCRNLTKLGHIAVDVKAASAGDGMPAVATAFMDALTDKTNTKINAYDAKVFIERASTLLPAVLLVVSQSYSGYEITVVSEADVAASWTAHKPRVDDDDDDATTDYEIELERLRLARVEAFDAHKEQVLAVQRDYVLTSKPAELISAVLTRDVNRAVEHLGVSDRRLLGAVLDVAEADLTAANVLEFAGRNASNLARVAATFAVTTYQPITFPALEALGSAPSYDDFRIDHLRYDEDGTRLPDDEYEQLVREEAEAQAEAEAEALASRDGEGDISEEEAAAIRDVRAAAQEEDDAVA